MERSAVTSNNLVAEEYLAECRRHLAKIYTGFRALEKGGANIDEDQLNRTFRAVHALKGAGFFGLVKIRELAHQTEEAFKLIRSRHVVATPTEARILLSAHETLDDLIRNPATSNEADATAILVALAKMSAIHRGPSSPVAEAAAGARRIQVLLAEDDAPARLTLETFFAPYGDCDVAVDGKQAVDTFRASWDLGKRYDLICMDVLMPEMDGREAVRQVRAYELSHGVFPWDGAKIIMASAMGDMKEVVLCFNEFCDAFLVKPLDLNMLLNHLTSYRLV